MQFPNEIFGAVLLVAYNAFVILYVSRQVHKKFGTYMARKTIHLLSAGVSVLLVPILFSTLQIPLLLFGLVATFTLLGHLWKPYPWFQEKNNYADVYFTIACTILLAVFWNLNVTIGVLSVLFMAWGDGLTGIIRNLVYKQRNKGIWGNIGMFIVCGVLGYLLLGFTGFVGGAYSSVIEKFEFIDDNISIPLGSAAIMILLGL